MGRLKKNFPQTQFEKQASGGLMEKRNKGIRKLFPNKNIEV